MSLIGWPFFLLLATIWLLLNIALIYFWDRFRGKSIARNGQRFLLLVLAQLLFVITVTVGINRSMVFYGSWRDLFGGYETKKKPITQLTGMKGSPLAGYIDATRANPDFRSRGGQFSFLLTGAKSGVTAPVYIFLPPTYGADPKKKWPVLELLPGFPGVPTTWFHALDLARAVRKEVSTGRAHDFVIVLPTMSVAPPGDTECTDIPGGFQVNTWLGVDVPKAVIEGLSVSKDRKDWAIAGYSTGGFCAAKVALTHSDRFSVVVPIAPYFTPSRTKLFGGSAAVRDANSPLLLAQKLTRPIQMLLVGTKKDPGVMEAIASMKRVRNPNLIVDQLIDPIGGHSTKVWKYQLPRILDWLSVKIP
ncbi:MAG: hypothetical protein HY050_05520 [Actinobacteria bacterium]|nr:hypothetical protein [Actinomycetota bacterium]